MDIALEILMDNGHHKPPTSYTIQCKSLTGKISDKLYNLSQFYITVENYRVRQNLLIKMLEFPPLYFCTVQYTTTMTLLVLRPTITHDQHTHSYTFKM